MSEINTIRYFDCNTLIGLPAQSSVTPPATAESLVSEMSRAGIDKALVWHVAQRDACPLTGNTLLSQAITPFPQLMGCWSLLPDQTGELGDLSEWFTQAFSTGIRAFRCWPRTHRYLLHPEVMNNVCRYMIDHHIPLLFSLEFSFQNEEFDNWRQIYDLMRAFPNLTLILCDMVCLGSDRFFRILIEKYPNVYLEIGSYFLDGGIKAFVESYGPKRLLFGSNFPAGYHGSTMLALAHAEISWEDKRAIASKNLENLLAGVR